MESCIPITLEICDFTKMCVTSLVPEIYHAQMPRCVTALVPYWLSASALNSDDRWFSDISSSLAAVFLNTRSGAVPATGLSGADSDLEHGRDLEHTAVLLVDTLISSYYFRLVRMLENMIFACWAKLYGLNMQIKHSRLPYTVLESCLRFFSLLNVQRDR